MDFRLAPEEEQFRSELHDLLSRLVTPEVIEETESGQELGPRVRAVLQELGARGWLAPGWPKEYGGVGATPMQTALVEDALAHFRLLPAGRLVGVGVAGPMIMRFGNDAQRQRYLPAIARGEIEFCLAYTEPEAGSDLGSLKTRAWRDGDEYVIEGQKVFNTRAHYAQLHWLIARTDDTGDRRAGYSFFVVNSNTPGIVVTPMIGLSGKRTNAVFYDNVRVPAENLVGEEGRGWEYMTSAALAFERVFPVSDIEREFSELLAELRRCGRQLSPPERQRLADLAVRIRITRLLSWRVTWMQMSGALPGYEADSLKMLHSEVWQDLAATGLELLGPRGTLERGEARAALDGRMAYQYLDTQWRTIAGGTSEVMRNVIATRGLGLPRR
jgi:alkylation response protein AidB-like acyl-CoA dehydrogenase